jgi:hypothetical protein
MLKRNTHFEQVPLEVVKKIVEKAGAEGTIEEDEVTENSRWEKKSVPAGVLEGRRKSA